MSEDKDETARRALTIATETKGKLDGHLDTYNRDQVSVAGELHSLRTESDERARRIYDKIDGAVEDRRQHDKEQARQLRKWLFWLIGILASMLISILAWLGQDVWRVTHPATGEGFKMQIESFPPKP